MAKGKNPDGKATSKKPSRTFPRVSLEEALRVAEALKDNNAGNPWPPGQVAEALGMGPKSSTLFYITAGSRHYGLTDGTRDAAKISLTPLGRRVVYPNSAEEEVVAKREAFLKIDAFAQVLEYYKGSDLPEPKYLQNTLETEFGIDPSFQDDFTSLFKENCRFLSIGHRFDTGVALLTPVAEASTLQTSSAIVVNDPSGNGRVCFVIMPFVEREDAHPPGFFREVFESLILPAGQAAGFTVRTANRQGSDVIQSTIVNELLAADLVIADLTEHNPNVLFELGMRMREDKPICLIKATGTGRIFDVDNMLRVVEYDSCLWPSTIQVDLPKLTEHVTAAWENRDNDLSYMKLLRQAPLATFDQNRNF